MRGQSIRLIFLAACAGLTTAAAQTVTGTIVGSVFDASGAVVPHGRVDATNADTNFSRTADTDAAGNYRLTFLPLGVYRISAHGPGFKQLVREGVRVEADERLRLDLTLEVGESAQTVEVTAGAPLVQSNDATVGEVMESRRITGLPLNGRNFVRLIQLTAGVTPGRSAEFGGQTTIENYRGPFNFTANGQRATTNNFMIDGVDNNANLFNSGGIVIAPVVDAIQEFKVSTGNFSPEFGRATGGVVSLQTKAGTNAFHGSVFEFLKNSQFDANTFFNNRAGVAKPPFRVNQFGLTLGGPIQRNKTFFFVDYQGYRERDSLNFTASVPRPPALQGDFSGSVYKPIYDPATAASDGAGGVRLQPFSGNRIPQTRFDPISRQLLPFYPAPNINVGSVVSNFINNPTTTRNDDQFDVRIDQRVGGSGNLFGRYSLGDSERLLPGSLTAPNNPFSGGGTTNLSNIRAQSAVVNFIRPLTPRLLSETRLGFTRLRFTALPLGQGDPAFAPIVIPNHRYSTRIAAIPAITITRLDRLGPQANVPNFSVQNTYQASQNFVYNVGAHTIKFGGDLLVRQLNNDFASQPGGTFSFNGAYTNVNARAAATGGEPFADFLLGVPTSSRRDVLFGGFGRRTKIASWYVQDDIRVSRRLTLNLGIRWDLWTPFVEAYDRQSNMDVVAGKLIVASPSAPGGRALRTTDWNNFAPRLGLAYNLTGDGKTVLRTGYGISYLEDISSGATMIPLNPPFTYSEQVTNSQGIIPTRLFKDGFDLPVPPPIDRRLSGAVNALDFGYRTGYSQTWNFGIQRQLAQNLAVDAAYVGSKGTKLMLRTDLNQAVPGATAVALRPLYSAFPDVGTVNALLSAGNSSYDGLQIKVTKRYSSGLHFLASYSFSRTLEDAEAVGGGETQVAQDSRNLAAEKSLASFHRKNTFIFSYGYELPFGKGKAWVTSGPGAAILGGWSLSGITNLLQGNPFALSMSTNTLNTGGFQRPNRVCDGNLPGSKRTIDRWFDTSCFVAPAPFAFGNAGRFFLIGPGTVTFDSSIARSFRLKEFAKIDFRAEFFNLFNTPQFFQPNGSAGAGDFGRITDVRGGSNRQLQFALKVIF